MSLFDRIAQRLDSLFSSPEAVPSTAEEQAHLELLEQSSARIRQTVDAIRRGKLVAASSTTEDMRISDMLRYEQAIQMARASSTHMGAISTGHATGTARQQVQRLQEGSGPLSQRRGH